MAIAPHGITVTLPSGSISEPVSININEGGLAQGYSSGFNAEAGTAVVVSLDDPNATAGLRGNFAITSTSVDGVSFASMRAYVEGVDTSVNLGDVVNYTTRLKLIKEA